MFRKHPGASCPCVPRASASLASFSPAPPALTLSPTPPLSLFPSLPLPPSVSLAPLGQRVCAHLGGERSGLMVCPLFSVCIVPPSLPFPPGGEVNAPITAPHTCSSGPAAPQGPEAPPAASRIPPPTCRAYFCGCMAPESGRAEARLRACGVCRRPGRERGTQLQGGRGCRGRCQL